MTVTTYAPARRLQHHQPPTRDDGEKLVRAITARMTVAEHAKLVALAKAKRQTITATVRAALQAEMERR